jgi:catechol 2,3-dioxygenase-like lactoylglutathione lyase family enzyme
MAGFEVLGTNHTSFTVSSLDQIIPFFTEVLDFKLTSRAPRDPDVVRRLTAVENADLEIAFVRGAGHTSELIEYKSPPERTRIESRICDTGSWHIAFDVSDVEAAILASAAHGFHPVGEIVVNRTGGPNQGLTVVYLRNVDGIIVEFLQKPVN